MEAGMEAAMKKSETKEAKPCFIRFAALPFIQS